MILNFTFVHSNFRCLKFAVVKKIIKCDKKSDYFQCEFSCSCIICFREGIWVYKSTLPIY